MKQTIIILVYILIFNNFLLYYAFFKHIIKLNRRISELEAKYIIDVDLRIAEIERQIKKHVN